LPMLRSRVPHLSANPQQWLRARHRQIARFASSSPGPPEVCLCPTSAGYAKKGVVATPLSGTRHENGVSRSKRRSRRAARHVSHAFQLLYIILEYFLCKYYKYYPRASWTSCCESGVRRPRPCRKRLSRISRILPRAPRH
jgi:hypothetical protein